MSDSKYKFWRILFKTCFPAIVNFAGLIFGCRIIAKSALGADWLELRLKDVLFAQYSTKRQ